MAAYWVVVRTGRQELLDALRTAFSRHEAFTVIEDRRKDPHRGGGADTNGGRATWNGDDFVVVERGTLLD